MDKTELLDTLAMELEGWPKSTRALDVFLQPFWGCEEYCGVDKVGDGWPVIRGWEIRREDYLQRRTELINKPSWKYAPDWAEWSAQDEDGQWLWYEQRPIPCASIWVRLENKRHSVATCGAIPAGHNWRITLERRPVEHTAEEDEAFADIERRRIADREEMHMCDRCGGSYWSPYHDECPCLSNDQPINETFGGLKHDGGKVRAELLIQGMPRALEAVSEVLTFGAQKYAAHSWQTVPDNQNRYWGAKVRHEPARAKGEQRDPETGLLHLAHEACNALFLLELALQDRDK